MTFFKLLVIYAQLHSVISWCLYNSFSQSTAQINEVDWSPDGQYFSVASDVATVYQFNTLTPIWSQNYSNTVNTAKFSKLGKYFAVGTNANDTIFIYNVPSFTLYESLSAFAANAEQVNEVDFSPDDTKIVACGSNTYVSVVTITDVTNPYLSFTSKMVQSGKSVLTCKYSDVNDIIGLVCTGCNSDNQFLYSSNLTTLTTTSWNNGNTFYDADFQPNSNNTLYSAEGGGANKTLLVMTPTGVSSFSNTNYGNNIYAVSCAHDLSYIAIGMKKNFAIISTASKAIDFISNYTIPIWAVRASNNSNYVVVGTSTGSVDIYKRICPTCQIGSYESQSQCVLCSQSIVGCSSCKNASFCYSCYLGYFLDASNGCTQC
jgi:WD40 repeat protein